MVVAMMEPEMVQATALVWVMELATELGMELGMELMDLR
jgi:hypothetical protein